jgi:hypothetical protein
MKNEPPLLANNTDPSVVTDEIQNIISSDQITDVNSIEQGEALVTPEPHRLILLFDALGSILMGTPCTVISALIIAALQIAGIINMGLAFFLILIATLMTIHSIDKWSIGKQFSRWKRLAITLTIIMIFCGLSLSIGIVKARQEVAAAQQSTQAENVYPLFKTAFEIYKGKLGKTTSKGESAGSMPQQHMHENALVIWIEKTREFYKLPYDKTKPWQHEGDPVWNNVITKLNSEGKWNKEEELVKLFNPPEGKHPPFYGVAAHWYDKPQNWEWIGWLVWKNLYFEDTMFFQEFEHGKMIGPIRASSTLENANVLVILNDLTYHTVSVDAKPSPYRPE